MTENLLSIRDLVPADAPALRVLYARSVRENAAGFVQKPDFHGDIFARAEAYAESGGGMIGLFGQEEELLGFGGLKKKDAARAELCNLHVDSSLHGRGFGKYLAMELIDYAGQLGFDTVELHVTATQEKAIGLYRKLGFVETARRTFETAGQVFDTIFMERAV